MNGDYQSVFEASFMPHGHCYFWRPEILWLNVVSDLFIATTYVVIPCLIFIYIRKISEPAMQWVAGLFAVFVFLCGCTHIVSIWNIWHANYLFEGILKALTAAVSVATAVLLVPVFKRMFQETKAPIQTKSNQDEKK